LKVRFPLVYAAILLASAAAFLLIRSYGETLHAPAVAAPAGPPAAAAHGAAASPIFHVLLAMAAVVVAGRTIGRAFVLIRQPPVVGEVVAGILLGPSLLGRIAPAASAYILPPSVAPLLNVIAQVGVILYMFIIGLELNVGRLRERAHATILISHASIVAPFVLGSVLALHLYPRLATADVPFTSFALFMGVAMSITAFPVLARILADRRMAGTELGTMALACAAVDDVTAWCLLAFVVGAAQAKLGGAAIVAVSTIGFIAVMFLLVRPVVARFAGRSSSPAVDQETVAVALAGVLLSALATELIGVHAIFGAFLFGAVVPHTARWRARLATASRISSPCSCSRHSLRSRACGPASTW
jgi:Kef-type K+ transport system membrane component KefB